MKVSLYCVGSLKKGPLRELFDTYAQRFTYPFKVIEIPESPKGRDDEAMRLCGLIPENATLLLLDERGAQLSSAGMAEILENASTENQDLAFVIGGADGLGAALRARPHRLFAYGKATWPHQWVRVMLMEQLYRGQSILQNHPYHRI